MQDAREEESAAAVARFVSAFGDLCQLLALHFAS